MEAGEIDAGPFTLAYAHRGLGDARVLVVYVEGDGRSWISRHRPAADPTPLDPVALRLAAADRSTSVAYLARPCQLVEHARRGGCHPRHWTSHRYGSAAIGALDEALEHLLARARGRAGAPVRLVLVGYSGGGTIAALLAAGRGDVDCLVTVAANLDHVRWSELHRVSPLVGSANPPDRAAALAALPQVHLAGAADPTVPVAVLDAYLARLGATDAAVKVVVPGFDHDCCWADVWPQVLVAGTGDRPPPACTLPMLASGR